MTLDTKDYDKGLDKAEGKSKGFTKSLGDIGNKMTKIGGIATASLTVPILAGFKKMVDAASDLEQAQGAVETVFADSADTIYDFAKTSGTAVGLARSDFEQLAAVTGSFLQNLGYDSEEAANQTILLTERASDMAAVFNTDVSQALQAIQSGLKGEFNPLEQFGVKINAAAIEAKALQMGLGDLEGKVNDNAKAQAALALVMEQTDRIAGQFADESETFAVKMQILQARFKDTAAELGTKLLPYAIDLLDWASGMIDKFDALNPKQQEWILKIAGAAAALGPLLIVGGQTLVMVSNLTVAIPKLTLVLKGLKLSSMGAAAGIGIMAGALAAEGALQKEIYDNNMDTVDAISELNKKIAGVTGSYDDYLKRARDYNDSIYSQKNLTGNLTWSVTNAAQAIDVMTEEEYNAAKAAGEMSQASKDAADNFHWQGQATYEAADATEAMAAAMETVDFGTILSLATQYDEIMGEIADKQEEINRLTEISTTGGYLDGIYYSAGEAQTKISDLTGEVSGLQQSMTDLANQVVLDMFQATIAIDGVYLEEAEAYFQMAADMELISQEAADEAIRVYGNAIDQINAKKLDNKSATYTIYQKTVYTTSEGRTAQWQAQGGYDITNQPTLVGYGEAGTEEAFFVPQGKTIWDVAPASAVMNVLGVDDQNQMQAGRQETTNNYNINALIPQDEIVPTLEQLKVMT